MTEIATLPASFLLLLLVVTEYTLPLPGHRLRPSTLTRDLSPLIHAAILFIGSIGLFGLLTSGLSAATVGFLALFAVVHMLLDRCKAPLYGTAKVTPTIMWGLALYGAGHMVMLLLFSLWWGATLGAQIVETISQIVVLSSNQLSESVNTILLISAAYLFIGRGGAEIVRAVLDTLDIDQSQSIELPVGQTVGYLERYLLLTLVLLQQYGAIGFVLTAKSIARYSGMTESKQFAEYYLVGTLTSAAVAITVGVLLQVVL